MREIRSSGSAEGVMSNHDPYSDSFDAPYRSGSRGCQHAVRPYRHGTCQLSCVNIKQLNRWLDVYRIRIGCLPNQKRFPG